MQKKHYNFNDQNLTDHSKELPQGFLILTKRGSFVPFPPARPITV